MMEKQNTYIFRYFTFPIVSILRLFCSSVLCSCFHRLSCKKKAKKKHNYSRKKDIFRVFCFKIHYLVSLDNVKSIKIKDNMTVDLTTSRRQLRQHTMFKGFLNGVSSWGLYPKNFSSCYNCNHHTNNTTYIGIPGGN